MTTLPRHDARIAHVLGDDLPCTLLVRYPRCRTSMRLPSPEDEVQPEIVAVLVGDALVLDLDDALLLDGEPDALRRIERAAREGLDEADVERGSFFTPWAAVAL